MEEKKKKVEDLGPSSEEIAAAFGAEPEKKPKRPALRPGEAQEKPGDSEEKNQKEKPSPKKKSKAPFIFGITFALLAGVAIGAFTPLRDKILSSLRVNSEPTPEDSEETVEEISDPYLLRNLNHKLALLHGFTSPDSSLKDSDEFITTAVAYNSLPILYSDSDLTSNDKGVLAVMAGKRFFGEWNDFYSKFEAVKSFLDVRRAEYGVAPITTDELRGYYYVSYDVANNIYKDLFGDSENLKKEAKNGGCGRSYLYIDSTDAFIESLALGVGGCGGAGFPGFLARKDSFKDLGSEVHVDLSVLTTGGIDETSCNVYPGFNDAASSENNLRDLTPVGSFEPTSINCVFPDSYLETAKTLFGDSSDYRFVFKKNSDGTFYFSNVKKL